jgi:hypothetical protein
MPQPATALKAISSAERSRRKAGRRQPVGRVREPGVNTGDTIIADDNGEIVHPVGSDLSDDISFWPRADMIHRIIRPRNNRE